MQKVTAMSLLTSSEQLLAIGFIDGAYDLAIVLARISMSVIVLQFCPTHLIPAFQRS